ncbi:hypothetical protein [Streptomyces avermitilis]
MRSHFQKTGRDVTLTGDAVVSVPAGTRIGYRGGDDNDVVRP